MGWTPLAIEAEEAEISNHISAFRRHPHDREIIASAQRIKQIKMTGL